VVFDEVQKIDRAAWRRYLFYIDLAVIAVFVVSLVVAIRHAFMAGQWYANDEIEIAGQNLWLLVGDTVFVTGSLCWIFYRFFKNQYLVVTRRL
jgi:hypothetical protein